MVRQDGVIVGSNWSRTQDIQHATAERLAPQRGERFEHRLAAQLMAEGECVTIWPQYAEPETFVDSLGSEIREFDE
jgi:hypothetical protein